MVTTNIRIGVVDVSLPVDDTAVSVPGLSSITPVVTAITPDDGLPNDIDNPLSAADTYSVVIGLLAQDSNNKGYTITECSQAVTSLSVTAGQSLLVSVGTSSLPTYWDEAVALAVFLKTNNASNYQLQGYGYLDAEATEVLYVIDTKPLRNVPSFALSLLQSTTGNTVIGSRVAFGTTYETLTPTTGDTTENFPVITVPVSPNTGADFDVRTTVSNGFSFQLLANDLKNFIRAQGGNYVEYTRSGVTYRQGKMAMNTAQAILRGNKPMKLNFPPDSSGFAEVKLLIGNLTFNQQELTAAWSKSATTPINFVFQPANLDTLINNIHTSISYFKEA